MCVFVQVPFDEDQFSMTPNLENVTTLDHVALDVPVSRQREEASKAKGKTSAGVSGAGNNRVAANEQALAHFKGTWDVFWDGDSYSVIHPKAGEKGKSEPRKSSWLK